MRPLNSKELPTFLERFSNFLDAEFREFQVLSPTNFKITFATQDASRGYDWITISFELNNVSDANLLENSELSHIDLSEGINISNNGTAFALNIPTSTFYVECDNIKYQEGIY